MAIPVLPDETADAGSCGMYARAFVFTGNGWNYIIGQRCYFKTDRRRADDSLGPDKTEEGYAGRSVSEASMPGLPGNGRILFDLEHITVI